MHLGRPPQAIWKPTRQLFSAWWKASWWTCKVKGVLSWIQAYQRRTLDENTFLYTILMCITLKKFKMLGRRNRTYRTNRRWGSYHSTSLVCCEFQDVPGNALIGFWVDSRGSSWPENRESSAFCLARGIRNLMSLEHRCLTCLNILIESDWKLHFLKYNMSFTDCTVQVFFGR